MNKAKKLLALLLALVMVLGLAACGGGTTSTPAASGSNEAVSDDSTGSSSDTPLVVGYLPFSSKFSPFFAETAYDQDVVSMTQLPLLTSDRSGACLLYTSRCV